MSQHCDPNPLRTNNPASASTIADQLATLIRERKNTNHVYGVVRDYLRSLAAENGPKAIAVTAYLLHYLGEGTETTRLLRRLSDDL